MTATRIITVAGDPEQEAQFSAQLTVRRDVDLILRCVDRSEVLGSIRGATLDAIVSVGAPAWFDRQCAQEAGADAVRIVGIADDPLEAERLTSFGATVLPFTCTIEEVLEACVSAPVSSVISPLPSQPIGSLIAVWGPKGAPGRTRIATELAYELAATDAQTLLIDGDPYGGDILQLLGILDELPTVVWAARMAAKEELSATTFAQELRRTDKAGPLLLPGIPRADLWADISDHGWRALLALAHASFRFTICDVGFCLEPDSSQFGDGEGRNRMARATIGAADHVVAVCGGDPITVKNFIWSFPQLTELTDDDNVVVVVNRVDRSEEQQLGQLLRRYIGKRVITFIPDRHEVCAKALRRGVPVARLPAGSESAGAIRTLAGAVGGRVESRGLLARVAGNR